MDHLEVKIFILCLTAEYYETQTRKSELLRVLEGLVYWESQSYSVIFRGDIK